MALGAPPPDIDRVGTVLRRSQLLAGAIPMILPVLGFVIYVMGFRLVWPLPDVGVVRIAFIAVAAASFAAAPVIRALMLSKIEDAWRNANASGTEIDPLDAQLATLHLLAVTQAAVFELPVLLGFVLAVLSESATDFVLFAPIAIVGWVMVFPRRSVWETQLDPIERQGIISGS